MTMRAALIAFILSVISARASSAPITLRSGYPPGLEHAAAGPAVQSVPFALKYAGWQPLAPGQLIVWVNDEDGYLFQVSQPCRGLQSVKQISLTSKDGLVRSGVDSVQFSNGDCRIIEIRNLNFRTKG